MYKVLTLCMWLTEISFFVFGCVAFLFVAYTVVFEGRAYARILGQDILKTFTICGVWTISLWFLYPIAWGLSEGGNVISSDGEAIFYGILDLLAKREYPTFQPVVENADIVRKLALVRFFSGDIDRSKLSGLVFLSVTLRQVFQVTKRRFTGITTMPWQVKTWMMHSP